MIQHSVIIALAVLFIHSTFWEGMIFETIGKKLDRLPEAIKKPLFSCPICMTPWWGSFIIFLGNNVGLWSIANWLQWILTLFVAAGINVVLIYIINQGKEISKTLNEYECNCIKKEDKAIERKKRIAKVTKVINGKK